MRVSELLESTEDDDEELFMLRMMQKLLEKRGYKVLPFDGQSVDVIIGDTKFLIFYYPETQIWKVSMFDATSDLARFPPFNTYYDVLKLLAGYRE